MKRSVALHRLVELSAELTRVASIDFLKCSILSAHVWGDILDDLATFDVVSLVIVVDEPIEEVSWMQRPRHLEGVAEMLRLPKLPTSWVWRPKGWPTWNQEIERTACFWTAKEGADVAVIEALRERRFDRIPFDAPSSNAELVAQLRAELPVSRRHLANMTKRYEDQRGSPRTRRDDDFPGQHLWEAAAGYLAISDALGDGAG